MEYKDIAIEILEDGELRGKYNLPSKPDLNDSNIICTVIRLIAEEKEQNRTEQKSSTSRITRELNKVYGKELGD